MQRCRDPSLPPAIPHPNLHCLSGMCWDRKAGARMSRASFPLPGRPPVAACCPPRAGHFVAGMVSAVIPVAKQMAFDKSFAGRDIRTCCCPAAPAGMHPPRSCLLCREVPWCSCGCLLRPASVHFTLLQSQHRLLQPPKHAKVVCRTPAHPSAPSLGHTSGPMGKQVRNHQPLVACESKPAQDCLQKDVALEQADPAREGLVSWLMSQGSEVKPGGQ